MPSTPPAVPPASFAVFLVAITALGPMSTDFYLPALPALARALGTDTAGAQLTLSVYMIGFAFGQLILGPLSDRYGRRPVMLAGMAVYVLAAAACALATSIGALVAARFVMALGACAGPVLGRAVVRDIYGPHDAARTLSHIATGSALAPLVAPLFGGWLTTLFGWRSTFVALTLFALGLAIMTWQMLRETNLNPDPHAVRPLRMLANYRLLLADRQYRGALLTGSGAFAALFAFISAAPFVFIDLFGMTPAQMGLAFGTNVTGFMVGSSLSARLSRRLGSARLMRAGALLGAAGGIVLAALSLGGIEGPAAVILPMWAITLACGLLLPNATALALADYPHMAGAAASLMGFVQMGLGAAAGLVVGHSIAGSAQPMALMVGASMLLSLLAWWRWAAAAGAAERI